MIENLLLGIAIGDAVGAGVEFQDRHWIRSHVDLTRFVNARAQIAVPPGQKILFTENYQPWDYTDDTEMTIGVMKALCATEPFSEDLLIQKWKEEYELGIAKKGHGRNGHGSMGWYYRAEKTIEEIRDFQRNRANPGNAPAMRAVPLGLLPQSSINEYAAINANATHPNINAVLSSQCIAWATHFFLVEKGEPKDVIEYCARQIELNEEYLIYFEQISLLPNYDELTPSDFARLCGPQPIEAPYFLAGIHGVPSDSKYTTGAVLYVLQQSEDALDALRHSLYLGGDVDSVASITTGIMAARRGVDSLPSFMLDQVEGMAYLGEIALWFEAKMG